MGNKTMLFTAGALLAAMTASQAQALVFFDDTGGGVFGVNHLLNLDWAPGNSISIGGNAAVAAFAGGSRGADTEFTTYYQATLAGFREFNDINPQVLTGRNQMSIVVGIREKVIGIGGIPGTGGAQATFAFLPTGAKFLEIYYDNDTKVGGGMLVTEANNLIGQGFNDGSGGVAGSPGMILKAEITNVVTTSYSVTNGNIGALDQTSGDSAPSNDYPGINTVQGNASTTIKAQINQYDANFFKFDPSGLGIIQLAFLQNVGLDTPFLTVDPSSGFVLGQNVTGLNTAGAAPTLTVGPDNNPLNNTVGSVNGGPYNGTNPDIVFQTDTNMTFDTSVIPEPISAGLSFMGLAALAAGVTRRRRA